MSSSSDDIAVGHFESPVGWLSAIVTRIGLASVSWSGSDQLPELVARSVRPTVDDLDRLDPVLTQLAEYFRGTRRRFELPLDWDNASPQRQSVLKTLHSSVGYGSSVTYGELAARSGTRIPARGIGAIMAGNPLPIVVPCHRVVATNGLGGYSGGSGRNGREVKRWLLTLEGAVPATLDWNLDGLSVHNTL